MNYEVAIKPYLKGAENTTVVAIKMENNGRYSYEQVELHGDHTQDNEATLIQAVLDHIRTELDPTNAIVQAQAKLQEAEQELAETKAKQTATDQAVKHNQEETDRYGKIIHAVVLNAVAGKTIAYGTNYKELVELIPLAEVGKHYMAHDLITIEDPNLTEVNGEGKRVLVQVNREFTYNGEPLSDFLKDGKYGQNGVGLAWKFDVKG